MMAEIYAVLMSWAVTLSGYPAPMDAPEISTVPHSVLVAKACHGKECKVIGWFPPGNRIYLDERLRPDDSLYASSIVVHEMVHYLQQQSGRYGGAFSCEKAIAMEHEAYAIQQEYLVRYGVYRPVGASMHSVDGGAAAQQG